MDEPERRRLYDDLTDALYRIDQVVHSLTLLGGRLVMIRNRLHDINTTTDEERYRDGN